MSIFNHNTCNPLPFMNDLRENQLWFTQVIQMKNETCINPEHREQGWVFKNVFPSILLGITLLDFIQKIFCFYQVPKVLLLTRLASDSSLLPIWSSGGSSWLACRSLLILRDPAAILTPTRCSLFRNSISQASSPWARGSSSPSLSILISEEIISS